MDIAPYDHMSWDNERQPRQVALVRMAALFPVLIAVVTTSVLRSQGPIGGVLYAGIACLVLASLLSGTAAYTRFDQPTLLAMGALDLVAVVAIGSLPGAAAAGALVAVPGLWLGGIFRWRGVAIVAVVSGVAIALMEIAGGRESAVEQVSWIAIFALVASVAMATMVTVWTRQVDLLEAQRAELAVAVSALEEQQRYNAAIVETVDVGLAAVRADGSYSGLNPRHAELMALAFPAGHAGQAGQVGPIYAVDNRTRLERADLPSSRAMTGETFTETLWIGDEPAARRAILVSARPMRSPDGGFAGAVIAYHDVTSLMTALRVKDDFVAMVSHELRTPLTAIIGNIELAVDLGEGASHELPRILAAAGRNADRLLHIVSDLLTLAQEGEDAMQLSRVGVDVSELVTQSVDTVASRARLGGVVLTTEIEPGVRLRGDQGRLLQVTDNLLSNAVKYTHPGGRIWVTLCRTATDVLLTVQDTGIGVSESDQKELFTKFFRGQNARELHIPGVGLGLAISKDIVEAHGGSLELTSSERDGTTVLVTLPSGIGLDSNPQVDRSSRALAVFKFSPTSSEVPPALVARLNGPGLTPQ